MPVCLSVAFCLRCRPLLPEAARLDEFGADEEGIGRLWCTVSVKQGTVGCRDQGLFELFFGGVHISRSKTSPESFRVAQGSQVPKSKLACQASVSPAMDQNEDHSTPTGLCRCGCDDFDILEISDSPVLLAGGSFAVDTAHLGYCILLTGYLGLAHATKPTPDCDQRRLGFVSLESCISCQRTL